MPSISKNSIFLSFLDPQILSFSKHSSPFPLFFNQAAWLLPKSQLIWNNKALISRTIHRIHIIAPLVACLTCVCLSVCVTGRYKGVGRSQERLNVCKCKFLAKIWLFQIFPNRKSRTTMWHWLEDCFTISSQWFVLSISNTFHNNWHEVSQSVKLQTVHSDKQEVVMLFMTKNSKQGLTNNWLKLWRHETLRIYIFCFNHTFYLTLHWMLLKKYTQNLFCSKMHPFTSVCSNNVPYFLPNMVKLTASLLILTHIPVGLASLRVRWFAHVAALVYCLMAHYLSHYHG